MNIANIVLFFVERKNIILNNLKTISCDETIIDVRWRSGVVRKLAEAMQRWLHCLFLCYTSHGNKLQYSVIFELH